MMQTSSVEIERVCNQADESILETAAVSASGTQGGPEMLVVFVVLKEGFTGDPEKLRMQFLKAIQTNLNPLFKVCSHVPKPFTFSAPGNYDGEY